MSKRIEWVDVCKGFAMLLVMMGHTSFSTPIKTWLYTFHVPMFYFLSGYVFSVKKYSGFKEFLLAKSKTLLLPMVILGMIICISDAFVIPESPIAETLIKRVAGIFIELRGGAFDIKLWFIVSIFVAEVMFYMIIKFTKGNVKGIIAVLCICSLCAFTYTKVINRICPWAIETALVAVGYLGAGYLVRNYTNDFIVNLHRLRWMIIMAILSFGYMFLCYTLDYPVGMDIYSDKLGAYPYSYIGAFAGIFFSISVFQHFENARILKYIGVNSFIYYAFHKSLFLIYDKLIENFGISFFETVNVNIKGSVYVALSILIIAVFAWLINNYAPWIMGRTRTKEKHKNEI